MLQELLPYLAGLLQWARARKQFAEVWYLGIVAAASFAFYMFAHPQDAFSVPWPQILSGWWEQAQVILAMTQVISSGANVIQSRRNGAAVPSALPVTNSQS